MIREIVLYPDERLRTVADKVEDEARVKQVAEDLTDTLRSCENGHGLAAVQIGEMVQMCAVLEDVTKEEKERGKVPAILVYANPIVVAQSGSTKTKEGCLSLPGEYGVVKRPRKVRVHASLVVDGVMMPATTVEFSGFEAVVIQHEIDHLNGVIFLDKLVPDKA